MVLTTLLIGVFVPVIKASSTTTENVRKQLALEVFMVGDATKKQAKAAQRKIARIPHVSSTEYVSKAEGLKNLRGEIGEDPISEGITQLRGQNPLPILVIVHPDDPDNLPSIQAAISRPGSNGEPGRSARRSTTSAAAKAPRTRFAR